jgi:hypothetical protein
MINGLLKNTGYGPRPVTRISWRAGSVHEVELFVGKLILNHAFEIL